MKRGHPIMRVLVTRIAAKSENSLLQVETFESNLSNSCVFLGYRTRGR